MLGSRRARLVGLLVIALSGCGPEDGQDSEPGTSTTTPTSTSTTMLDGTSFTPSSGPATVDDGGSTTTGEPDPDTTTADTCTPGDPMICELDQCLQQWSFSCDCPDVKFDIPSCFELDTGCQWPRLTCDLPSPCSRVWAMGFDAIGSFEDEAAAICLLQSIRDGIPGHYELLYGDMGDTGLVDIDLFTDGGGTVLMQYQDTCQGCPSSGFFGRSGALELQPTQFFDDCLMAPTTQSLADCLVGLAMYDPGAPPPEGWAPPFTTGTCSARAWDCPEA